MGDKTGMTNSGGTMKVELLEQELLTKADCRSLGTTRPDVDRMFDRVPLVTLPDSRKVYVRRQVLDEWLDQHTRVAPRGL